MRETWTFHSAGQLLFGPNASRQLGDVAARLRVRRLLLVTDSVLLRAGLHERYARVAVTDKGKVFNTELMEAVELGFLLDVSDTLVAAALARDESRGAHYREDHPLRDDDHWLRHSLAYRAPDDEVRLEYKDVKMGPYIPMERKY